jgi:uncharacterized protein YsxB (DUF464 family)
MIQIEINYDDAFDIQIQGHAGYAEKGKDIVCAAISTLYQTLMISFENNGYGTLDHIRSNDGFEHVRIHDVVREGLGVITAFVIGCEAVSKEYPVYVAVHNELT